MARPFESSVKEWIEAPAADVWAVFRTLDGWTYWSGLGASALEGATVLIAGEEPETSLDYRVTAPSWARHVGRIELDERPHGTVVRWHVVFERRVPGSGRLLAGLMRVGRRYVLRRLENRMAPLERHRSECPYADAPDGQNPGLRLRGRRLVKRALLVARTG